jgi:hypothetical protein
MPKYSLQLAKGEKPTEVEAHAVTFSSDWVVFNANDNSRSTVAAFPRERVVSIISIETATPRGPSLEDPIE